VPDIRRSADKLLEDFKVYVCLKGASSELARAAHDRFKEAVVWTSQVENRIVKEQLHLDTEQPAKKVDFQPFCDRSSVSIYEFFGKFEAWARGRLTLDSMAYVLYTQHLDASVVSNNKELEVCKESYTQMKNWLCNKYGRPAHVANLYLENIQRLTKPADGADSNAEADYLKTIYGVLVTLTRLEAERGTKIQKLEDYIFANDFLLRLGAALPAAIRNQVIDSMPGDKDYLLIEGEEYMHEFIRLVKREYTKAEVTASTAGGEPLVAPVCQRSPKAVLVAPVCQRPPKAVLLASTHVPGSLETSSAPDSDGTSAVLQPGGSRPKMKKTAKSSAVPGAATAATVPNRQPGKPTQKAMQKSSKKTLEQKTVEQQEETVVQQLGSQSGKKKAAVQQQEVTLELEEAAVAAADTGGAGFYTHRARATLPC
jgi:hypothetical protein